MTVTVTAAICALGVSALGDLNRLDAGELSFSMQPESMQPEAMQPEASERQASETSAAGTEMPAETGPFTLFGPSGKRFGQAGARAWTLGGLYAHNFNEANDFNAHVAWSNFLADDFEFGVEAAGWYFNQPGQDTGGVSGSMLVRWHFAHDESYSWSVFVDGGIGLLAAFDEVPAGGTEFNFLPRLGAGATFALGDGRDGQSPRLMVGARWHHMSNARIRGDSDNPARDGLAGYLSIVFPF